MRAVAGLDGDPVDIVPGDVAGTSKLGAATKLKLPSLPLAQLKANLAESSPPTMVKLRLPTSCSLVVSVKPAAFSFQLTWAVSPPPNEVIEKAR